MSSAEAFGRTVALALRQLATGPRIEYGRVKQLQSSRIALYTVDGERVTYEAVVLRNVGSIEELTVTRWSSQFQSELEGKGEGLLGALVEVHSRGGVWVVAYSVVSTGVQIETEGVD